MRKRRKEKEDVENSGPGEQGKNRKVSARSNDPDLSILGQRAMERGRASERPREGNSLFSALVGIRPFENLKAKVRVCCDRCDRERDLGRVSSGLEWPPRLAVEHSGLQWETARVIVRSAGWATQRSGPEPLWGLSRREPRAEGAAAAHRDSVLFSS